MTKKIASSRILKSLDELFKVKELTDSNFIQNKEKSDFSQKRLFLRKKNKLDYSNKFSEAAKKLINSGMGFGRWTYEEHKNFIEGIFQFGNKWKEIVKLIKTRNCIQARSHSQKFFFKIFKFTSDCGLVHYVNLKNLFSFGKYTGEVKLDLLKEFLIKAYDQIENGENIDFFKSNLLIEFLNKLEKSKKNLKREIIIKNSNDEDGLLKVERLKSTKISKVLKRENYIFNINKVKRKANLKNIKNELICNIYKKLNNKLKEKIFLIEKIKRNFKERFISPVVNKITNLFLGEESANNYKQIEIKSNSSLNQKDINNYIFTGKLIFLTL